MPVDPAKRELFIEHLLKTHKDEAETILYTMHGPQVRVPFMSPMLTWATNGGVSMGHMCRWYGPEGCLSGDAFIPYETRSPSGRTHNTKGGTIERLYERFNEINVKKFPTGTCQECGNDFTKRSQKTYCGISCRNAAMGKRKRSQLSDLDFYTASVDDNGRIVRNKILNVARTGTKHTYKLTTASGKSITATDDHKFLIPGGGYVTLSQLSVGDTVFVHNNVRIDRERILKPRSRRPQTTVKFHPYGQAKTVNGYEYKQVAQSRLIVEARLNNLTYEAYKDRLNSGEHVGLIVLSPDDHVHHIDENPQNNDLSNLVVLPAHEHNRLHALERHQDLRFIVVEDAIEEISYVGETDTYDIQMASPFNNYVANGIVVHNSGKSMTNWGLIYVAQNFPEVVSEWYEVDIHWFEQRGNKLAAQKVKKEMKDIVARFPNGLECCIFDTEQRVDLDLAARMGIDVPRIEPIINENIIEEIISDATRALEAFHIIIIDSASNAQSMAEAALEPGEYDRGTAAKAWNRLKQFRRHMNRHEHILVIVDQMRSQGLGGGKMYSGPQEGPPGGRFLKHNSSLSIEYSQGTRLYLDKNFELTDEYKKASPDIKSLGTDGKEPHGLEMRCKVQKNSTGKPFRNARMRFRFPVADTTSGELLQDVGFDTEFELLEIGLHYGMIEASGSSYYYGLDEDGKKIKGAAWQGKANAVAGIAEDEDMQYRILGRLRRDMR